MKASPSNQASSGIRPDVLCPVCHSPSETTGFVVGWGTWQQCHVCTLSFADPLSLPKQPEELFDGAYRGTEAASGFQEFAHRVRQRKALVVEPELWFWSPAFDAILDWLGRRVGRGATVLEVGCGLGFLLHAMRRRGFDAVGVDVAEAAVELNRADGFRVWHGTVGSIPSAWTAPEAIVSTFMLHHLEQPLETLAAIRRRWPATPLAIAQYGPTNQFEHHAMPPRNLTRWNEASLANLLRRAGYKPAVTGVAAAGEDARPLRAARRLVFERLVRFPVVYRFGKRTADRLLHAAIPARPDDDFVLLAFAEPDPDWVDVPAGGAEPVAEAVP